MTNVNLIYANKKNFYNYLANKGPSSDY